jgi:hypothetical protein
VLAEPGDNVQQLVPDARVEAHGRFVEEQHTRTRDERPGDLQPAPLAAAVAADRPVEELGDAERLSDVGDA